ncbi:MAG: hypothetical protein HZB30_10680 [Nitrospirae bacterium]|nr:hypothetical protein [Nitrospirota bacterium]
MNTIEKIQSQINDASEIKKKYESILASEPNNFAYKLSLKSIEEHISDLQMQLQKEKALREKEVLEIRLKGEPAKSGSIPLSILAHLAGHLSTAILTASQRLKTGINVRGRIQQEVINTLDLRLAGISGGSTRLFITGNTSPDMFGYSLLENSLESTFELLLSTSPDELSETASKIGPRSIHRFNNFLKSLSVSGLEVDMYWSTPTQKNYEWLGNKDLILRISNSLDSLKTSEPIQFAFEGKLVMASLKGNIEVEISESKSIKGTFPSNLLENVKKLHIGEDCKGLIEQSTIINQTTGYEKKYYTVLKIDKHIDDSPIQEIFWETSD